jgi:DNA repair protein RadC
MAIRQWPRHQRSREKLLIQGAKALSNAEFAYRRAGNERYRPSRGFAGPLLKADQDSFCAAKGLGPAKYCQMQATLELTKRYLEEELQHNPIFTKPKQVEDYLAVQMKEYQREVFSVFLLDTRHQLLGYHELFHGTIDTTSVHPREVVRLALQKNAAAIIVAHNHPSGCADPSQSNIAITQRLKVAFELVDIRLLDHCIIGQGDITSLADLGKI